VLSRFQNLNLTVTPLVSYGIVFLTVLLSWFGVENFFNAEKRLANEAKDLRMRLAVVEDIKSQNIWSDRFDFSLRQKNQMKSSIWHANTSGVIAAELQQYINKISDDLGLKNIKLRVDPQATVVDDINSLAFDLTGRAESEFLALELLTLFAQHERQIILRDINIINDLRERRPSRFVVSGEIPIFISSEVAE